MSSALFVKRNGKGQNNDTFGNDKWFYYWININDLIQWKLIKNVIEKECQ